MRRKSMVVNFNKISSEAGEFTQNVVRDTQHFVKDISKEMSKIDWERMYKNAQKSLRSTAKEGNKSLNRSIRKFRKTNLYRRMNRVLTRTVPRYYTQFSIWSIIQIRKMRNLATSKYYQSRRLVLGKSPSIRSFVKENYPKVENFVLNQIPAYRIVFAR